MKVCKNTITCRKQQRFVDIVVFHPSAVEKMCVSGISSSSQSGGKSTDNKVEFGHTFPRKPTVLASLYYVDNNGGGKGGASTYVQSVSNSSAVIRFDTLIGNYKIRAAFAWLACL